MSFITLPTVVSFVQKDADVSVVFSMAEEEEAKSSSEVKEVVKAVAAIFTIDVVGMTSNQIFHNTSSYSDITLLEIPLPPPELV